MTMKSVADAVNDVRRAPNRQAAVSGYLLPNTDNPALLDWRAKLVTALRVANLWPPVRP